MSQVFNEEVRFLGQVSFRSLPLNTSSVLPSSTTPDVSNLQLVKGSGVVVTVSNFVGGADGQLLRVIGDGTTTVANNSKIKTNTAANKLLAVNKVYTFSYYLPDNLWIENG